RPAAPAGPVGLDPLDDAAGLRVVAEAHQHLIERDVVEYLVPGSVEPRGEAGGMATAALDQVREPRAAQRRQRRPDLDPARPARQLGRVVVWLARGTVHQIGGGAGSHGTP